MPDAPPPDPAAPEGLAALLRQRAFVLFWASRFLTVLAAQAQGVTIAWQVYELARRSSGIEQSALNALGRGRFRLRSRCEIDRWCGHQ